jgi:hypothetical protein
MCPGRVTVGAVLLFVGYLISIGSSVAGATEVATSSAPRVRSLQETPGELPASGGLVTVIAKVADARTCQLVLVTTELVPTSFEQDPVRCTSGTYRQRIRLASNATSLRAQENFHFVAKKGRRSEVRSFEIDVLPTTAPASVSTSPTAPTFSQEPNWSGFVVSSAPAIATDVSGEWTVPTLNCASTPNATDEVWVGTGGYGASGVLLQTGVENDCVNGIQKNLAWWDLYPHLPSDAELVFSNFTVSTGDLIKASVYQSVTNASQWVTRVDDLTTGISAWMVTGESWGVGADTSTTFAPQGSTAELTYQGGTTDEWIVEDPLASSGSLTPFADFGAVTFSNVQTNLATWSLTTSEGVEIVQNGAIYSQPSSPGTNGFSVNYLGGAVQNG